MRSLPRQIGNPITGEYVIIKETTAETNGEYMVFRTHLPPGSGIFRHYHTAFTETFSDVAGVLDVTLDGKPIAMKEGDVHLVGTHHTHGFRNNTDEAVEFTTEVRPACTFEAFIRCGYGLDTDGRSFYMPFLRLYMPKNLLLWGPIFSLGMFFMPYVPRSLQTGGAAILTALAQVFGVAKTLDRYYEETH